MIAEALLGAVGLGVGIVLGLLVHEGAHATVLGLFGVDCHVEFFPGRVETRLRALTSTPWAVVHPVSGDGVSPWKLRVAALAPLAVGVSILGVVGSGVVTLEGNAVLTGVFVGWLACCVPSPQDFSTAMYAHRLADECPTPR